MSAKTIPILMYHHVTPSPGLVSISPENFKSQMEALASHGYRTAGLKVVEDFLSGKPIADKTVILTFDDGYLDNYIYAYPILREFNFNAVIFIVTGWVGDGEPRDSLVNFTSNHRACVDAIQRGDADSVILRWSEIYQMKKNISAEFYSHTHTHQRYDLQNGGGINKNNQMRADLMRSRKIVESRLDDSPRHLCWPQGYFDSDYISIAHEFGFEYLYSTNRGALNVGDSRETIPRIVVKDREGGWLLNRLVIYRSPLFSKLYGKIHG